MKQEHQLQRLKSEFLHPPAACRAMPMYSFDYSDPEAYAARLLEGGWGGCNVQFPNQGSGYLQRPEDWSRVADAVKAIEKHPLSMWIYDERAYPSGKAGTLVLDGHPELEAQGLYYDAYDLDLRSDQDIVWHIPPGTPYLVCAMRMDPRTSRLMGRQLRLTALAQSGVLNARLQAGRWRVMAFVKAPLYAGTHAELLNERYPNLLDPNTVCRFLQITHERYKQHIGGAFGKTVQAFFTDEPSLLAGYLVDQEQPYAVINWWHELPAAYRRLIGQSIDAALPALFNDAGPDTGRLRCQYYHTVSQLIARNFFAQLRRWCATHGLASTGHLLWEESLLYHGPFYGSLWPSLKEMDWPGIDVLGCVYGCTSGARTEGGPVTPKLISSVARVHRKPRTVTESFCFVDLQTPLESVMAHAAWEWVLGINTMNTLSFQQTHPVAHHRTFNEFVGRLSLMLTQGEAVCDVAVLYPIASVWANYVPNRHPVWYFQTHPDAAAVDAAWQQVSRCLLECPCDFDYIDESDLTSARIQGKRLNISTRRYRVLVLPAVSWVRAATLAQLVQFAERGGTVVCVGGMPTHCWDVQRGETYRAEVEMLKRLAGRGDTVRQVNSAEDLPMLLETIQDRDVMVSQRPQPLYYQHRSVAGADVYFFVNNSEQASRSHVSLRAMGRVELWDPWTGEIRSGVGRPHGRRTDVELSLEARRSVFVVLRRV